MRSRSSCAALRLKVSTSTCSGSSPGARCGRPPPRRASWSCRCPGRRAPAAAPRVASTTRCWSGSSTGAAARRGGRRRRAGPVMRAVQHAHRQPAAGRAQPVSPAPGPPTCSGARSTFSPTTGQPSARSSASASCRNGSAGRPDACTTRCHGTSRPWLVSTVPTVRGEPLPMSSATSPYVITLPRGMASTTSRTSRAYGVGGAPLPAAPTARGGCGSAPGSWSTVWGSRSTRRVLHPERRRERGSGGRPRRLLPGAVPPASRS
jgi:hypothetical protein